MEKITSNQFYKAWVDIFNSKKKYNSIWKEHNLRTSRILKNEDALIVKVAKDLNLNCYNDNYYSLDAILYSKDDLVPGRKKHTYYFRDIRVAFEHENKFDNNLYIEVAHLLITNCDLKVIVTYSENPKSVLNFLRKVILGNRHSKEISEEESFLIIIGDDKKKEWNGYVYKESEWEKIILH